MAEELGKIERPAAAEFDSARKLLLVPLLLSYPDAPVEYTERFDRYWAEVREQVERLSLQLGHIDKVFHEMVFAAGDFGVAMLEGFSQSTQRIVGEKCEQGATMVATEDLDLLQEAMDWHRCLLAGLGSPKVARQVADAYREATQRRYQHIAQAIDDALGEREVGVIFIAEDNSLQFPDDVQVFYVAPPSLNDIHRWLAEQRTAPPPDPAD